MKWLAILILLSCDKLPKPPPRCHLSLKDTPDNRECERACKLATYAAENRVTRLGWCLTDLCRADLGPAGCSGSYDAAWQPLEWAR